jgi:hypothetical protein
VQFLQLLVMCGVHVRAGVELKRQVEVSGEGGSVMMGQDKYGCGRQSKVQ